MKLPFLKEKSWPRVAPEPRSDKSYNLSASEQLEDHCMDELFDASHSKDSKAFRAALEALVITCFENQEESHAN